MKKIHYISFYTPDDLTDERRIIPSANNKIKYLVSALNKIGYKVNVISAAMAKKESKHYFKIDSVGNEFTLLHSKRSRISIVNRVYELLFKKAFLKTLLKIISDGELVIVYHSLWLNRIIKKLTRKRTIKIIYEVEELYSDVLKLSPRERKKEINFLSKKAHAYIFPNTILHNFFPRKPAITLFGSYKINNHVNKDSYNKIRCVYSGTLDPTKGVLLVIALAKYLTEKYEIIILGVGSEKEEARIKKTIESMNKESECKIDYLGTKTGVLYEEILSSCSIGFCTQNIDAKYNSTSFPSKILSYLCSGLTVVTCDIPAIKLSPFADSLIMYNTSDPKKIAKIITSSVLKEKESIKKIVIETANCFEKDLKNLIKTVNK